MSTNPASVSDKARSLMSWIKKGIAHIADPEKEQRIEELALKLQKELRRLMKDFNLDDAAAKLSIDNKDLSDVCLKAFSNILGRAWEDGDLSESEAKSVNWAGQVLGVPEKQAGELKIAFGKAWFERHLARAFDDGEVTPEEAFQLNELAKRLGTTLQVLIHRYFSEESESFLRGIFFTVIEDGQISDKEWARLVRSVELLGFSANDLFRSVQPQICQLIEHVLADAKSDGLLSAQEDDVIASLLKRFELPWDFLQYIEAELSELRQITEICHGKLPSITSGLRVECRAGEVVHLQEVAHYQLARQRRGEVVTEDHVGWLILTDTRLVFVSEVKSFQVSLRNIIRCEAAHNGKHGGFELSCGSMGSGYYYFRDSGKIGFILVKIAIGRANQTIVQDASNASSRYISRDVRQRVWQRFGGRCAQCSANSYLEFDHIIPVAKGGGNSEANIQLLCRGCNLSKSDEI